MTERSAVSEESAVRLIHDQGWQSRAVGGVWLAANSPEGHEDALLQLLVADADTAVSEAVANALLGRGDRLGVELFVRAYTLTMDDQSGTGQQLFSVWWEHLGEAGRLRERLMALVLSLRHDSDSADVRSAAVDLLAVSGT
ncbi:hypothetical protein [Arthrobacter sp. NPDC090010]|uniref:hypothetical protein n=1 Tax=Arthrobacter sp. NPDC090010 TaxID=3363942 RepID=UPI0037F58600